MKNNLKQKTGISLAILLSAGLSFPSHALSTDATSTRASTPTIAQPHQLAPTATHSEANGRYWDIPFLKQAYISLTPEDKQDGHKVGKLNLSRENQNKVIQFAKDIANKKHGDYDSLLISHKGQLVLESYYHRGRIDLPHDQASAAKAYTSLLLGRVIQLGYLTMADLDRPIIHFFKGLDSSKFAQGVESVTLHKALTMSGGLKIPEKTQKLLASQPSQLSKEALSRLQGQGFIKTLLENSAPVTPENQTFFYGDYNPTLVMQVINAVVPGSAEQFIKKEFLDKLGITDYSWATAISGLPEDGWRVSMTSRDMMKVANLVNNDGVWKGQQLISADYLEKATQKHTIPTIDWMPDHYSYGYLWYVTDVKVNNKSYRAEIAWGGFGQRLVVVKALDLTIAFTGYESEDTLFEAVASKLIPAFI